MRTAPKTRFPCGVKCGKLDYGIETLSDYFQVTTSLLGTNSIFWFRGHTDSSWSLIPSALRFATKKKRLAALALIEDFRRIAEIKLDRPPQPDEHLKWMQLAQHYGVPTRLLDWTESAAFALYFACSAPSFGNDEADGVVFILNPEELTAERVLARRTGAGERTLDAEVSKYMDLGPSEDQITRLSTIAIRPVWNSERLMMQRGVFTLHGSVRFALDNSQASSLVAVRIPRKSKKRLRQELDGIGIDEMTMFPELEYASLNLKRRAGRS